MTSSVPASRVRAINDAPLNPQGSLVLYWMSAARRTRWNFALQHAVDHARETRRPLVILEALPLDYPWASDRLHRFLLDGMADNQRALARRQGVTYLPWIEQSPGADRGLFASLASSACVVVTDDYPTSSATTAQAVVSAGMSVRMEAVDGNGLLPMRAATQVFPTAYAFRRYVQRTFAAGRPSMPQADPLEHLPRLPPATLPQDVHTRWPVAAQELIDGRQPLASLAIDHRVAPVSVRGGAGAAAETLRAFLDTGLARYASERNQLEPDVSSHLSPYLHFGHIAAHEVFDTLMSRAGWLGALPARATGGREGWWGVDAASEAFLDQLVTWRELGFNLCVGRPADYDRYESLPAWARATLNTHRDDRRVWVYDLPELERAATHDPLWNAAERQLIREGRIHNYVRMLWGKKILEWSESPEAALAAMIELNNKYALDGSDPNSYSGIFWTLGRYDRPWAPERPIFGTIRYMSSQNTARKMKVGPYLHRFGPETGAATLSAD